MNFSEISIGIHIFSFKKIPLKMSSGNWWPFCLSLNMASNKNVNSKHNVQLQLVLPVDHWSLGASEHTNVPETTHIGVKKNNWGMQSKMVFKICEGILCSSFYVKEFNVIVHKKYFPCITLLNFWPFCIPNHQRTWWLRQELVTRSRLMVF